MSAPDESLAARAPSPTLRALLFASLIFLISFLWFWFWRSRELSGGDSEMWERDVAGGLWMRRREILSFVSFQAVYRLMHALLGWNARAAMNLVSCAAGGFAMVFLWLLVAGRPHARLAFALVATAGFSILFYGHLETYAQPMAVIFLHLLSVRRAAEGRWPLWYTAATYLLVAMFHMVILFTLPAFLFLWWKELRRRGHEGMRSEWPGIIFVAAASFALWWIVARHWRGTDELIGAYFVLPLHELIARPWRVLESWNLSLKLPFFWVNAGVAPLVALVALWRARQRLASDLVAGYAAAMLLCFMGFALVWGSSCGERDFDLFSFPPAMMCIVVALLLDSVPALSVATGLMFGANLWLWLMGPALFADLGHNETGTIYLDRGAAGDEAIFVLDERFHLEEQNGSLLPGGHQIDAHIPPNPTVRQIVVIDHGERFDARWNGERFDITSR